MKTVNLLELKEKKQHGNLNFPVMTYQENLTENGEIAMHWHEEIEIAYIASGSAVYSVGSGQVCASAGDFVIIEPYTLHMIKRTSKDLYTGKAVIFNLGFLEGASDDCVNQKYIQPAIKQDISIPHHIKKEQPDQERMVQLFYEVLSLFQQKGPVFELFVKAKLLELMALLLEGGETITKETPHKTKNLDSMKAILSYLKQNYNEELSLSEIAKRFSYSTNYFSRLFKEQTGKTFLEYVNDYRIQRAAQMLIFSDQHITDIAMEVGFNNISYFIRQFKKVNGCSPMQFRKQFLMERQRTS